MIVKRKFYKDVAGRKLTAIVEIQQPTYLPGYRGQRGKVKEHAKIVNVQVLCSPPNPSPEAVAKMTPAIKAWRDEMLKDINRTYFQRVIVTTLPSDGDLESAKPVAEKILTKEPHALSEPKKDEAGDVDASPRG